MMTLLDLVTRSRFFTIHSQGRGIKRYIVPDRFKIRYKGLRIVAAELTDYGMGYEPGYEWRLDSGQAIPFKPDAPLSVTHYQIVELVDLDLTKEVPE